MEPEQNKPILRAYGVSHSFAQSLVLKEISLEIFKNEITAIIGPNGSGKSTLLKILAGILPLKQGQIFCQGAPLSTLTADARGRAITYLSSDLHAEFPLTAFEAVLMGRICQNPHSLRRWNQRENDAVHSAMEQCYCWEYRDRTLQTLSGGERQLVNLARALAQGSKVLLLDEALSKMDLNHQSLIGKLLKKLTQKTHTIVIVSHDLNLSTEWADSCVLLHRGALLASGNLHQVLTSKNMGILYPGTSFLIGEHPISKAPKVFF